MFGAAIIFAGAIIASGIAWLIFIRRERHEPIVRLIRTRVVTWLFVSGLIGLFLIFFRWQGIPYFAGRIWLLLWLVISFGWLVTIVAYILKKFPKERRLDRERLLRERYLPKRKR